MPRRIWRRGGDLRRRLYEILEHGTIGDRTGLIVGRLIVVLIVTNLVTMTLDSVPALQAQYGPLFIAIELLSLVVFTVEYALRVWVAAERAPHRHSSERKARWEFISSPLGVIDLLAVLPFWFAFILPGDLRVLLVFRMVRFLKLARYSPAMRSLLDALYNERRALFGCFVILLGATLVAASVMHVIEGHAQPDKFGTIPDAMWWAIVTLGTIGYGDVVPVTVLGRIVVSITIFVGLIMIALPIGIVATAFGRRNPSPRLRRHLGHGRARAVVCRTASHRYRQHHAALARAAGRGRRHHRQARRARSFHVFRRRWRSGDRAQARARPARRRSFLRRGRSAAAGAQVRDRYRAHADKPARARCPRSARAHGAGTAYRATYP